MIELERGVHLQRSELSGLPAERFAWTAPRTWTTGETVTAAMMNAHVRDNTAWLGGADGVGTSFPGSPTDGQLYTYVADGTNGVYWTFRYRTAAAAWFFVGGPPLFNEVTTAEATASAAYTALTTPGPAIALPFTADYDVLIGCRVNIPVAAGGDCGFMSYDIGGSAAVDADAVFADGQAMTGGYTSVARKRRKTALTAVTLTAKYKTLNGGSLTFADRFMAVWPVKK